jgi:CHAD domain-containing protein
MSTVLKMPSMECNGSYCRFGSDLLTRLMQAFENQISGVIEDKDVEFVHKMRVTSRKIRAVLPLFRSCYPKRKYKKWVSEIKPVTKLLGEARDLDVQIVFLQDYIKNNQQNKGLIPLLKLHKDRRKTLQEGITEDLKKLQVSGVLTEIINFSKKTTDELSQVPFDASSVIKKSSEHMTYRLDEFLALSGCVYQESEVLKHHEMRIYAKKLRYTMEAFSPLYKDGLEKEIRVLKGFQDLLGEMHDCDVWLNFLSNFAALKPTTQRELNSSEFKQAITQFSVYLKERKKSQYAYFTKLWAETESQDFFGRLSKTFTAGLGSSAEDNLDRNWTEIAQNARDLTKAFLQDTVHSEQVRTLALSLFDNLTGIHHYGDHERCLLESAALMHDLGLAKGARGHHKASMKMILTDTSLPLTSEERRVVASIARYHRRGLPKQKHYNLAALESKTIDEISALSSILRLADALDCSHKSDIKIESVKLTPKKVLIECFSKSGTSLVEQAFDEKKDLFEKFFKKKTVLIWTQQ